MQYFNYATRTMGPGGFFNSCLFLIEHIYLFRPEMLVRLACFCNVICQKLISVYLSLPPLSTLLYSNQLFLIDSLFPLIMYLDQKGSFDLKPSGYDHWNLSDSFEALISVGLTSLHHKTTKDCTQDPTRAIIQSS